MKLFEWLIKIWRGKESVVILIPQKPRNQKPKKKKLPQCLTTGKVSRTESDAKKRAKGCATPQLRAYKCEYCPHWHLTHKRAYRTF